ncbi:TPA: abortive infection system antitoxin AbiGi family protein [Vibrio diabolicus]
MNPKSHTLFHFTKNKEVLKVILKGGFWPRYCPEDVSWLSYPGFDFVAYPMVCFCDIPLSRIQDHVKFYGDFGIGLTREWALQNNATPVHYISESNTLIEIYRKLSNFSSHLEDCNKKDFKKSFRYLLAHSKPTVGQMVVNGDLVEKEFYQESEWRCVPQSDEIEDHLSKSKFEDAERLELFNEATLQHCKLEFTPKDIKYIFVKNDSDIPDLISFMQSDLGHFPYADIQILMSKVISLESISLDL